MSQIQTDSRTQQRLLAIELNAPVEGAVEGVLLLPFGLLLNSAVTLQVDSAEPTGPLRFRTCVAGGCVVPLALDDAALTAFRGGTALKINATASDSRNPVAFTVSLAGFAGALARTEELAR